MASSLPVIQKTTIDATIDDCLRRIWVEEDSSSIPEKFEGVEPSSFSGYTSPLYSSSGSEVRDETVVGESDLSGDGDSSDCFSDRQVVGGAVAVDQISLVSVEAGEPNPWSMVTTSLAIPGSTHNVPGFAEWGQRLYLHKGGLTLCIGSDVNINLATPGSGNSLYRLFEGIISPYFNLIDLVVSRAGPELRVQPLLVTILDTSDPSAGGPVPPIQSDSNKSILVDHSWELVNGGCEETPLNVEWTSQMRLTDGSFRWALDLPRPNSSDIMNFSEDGLFEVEVGWQGESEEELNEGIFLFDKEREIDLAFSEKAEAKEKQKRPRGRPRKGEKRGRKKKGGSAAQVLTEEASLVAKNLEEEAEQGLATVEVDPYGVSTRAKRALRLGKRVGVVLECSEEVALEALQRQINSHKAEVPGSDA